MVGGIGGPNGGGPPGPGKVGGVGGPGAPATSEVHGPAKASFREALGVERAEGAGVASPLERLRAGEIDLQGYVDLRVREATAHLEGVLSPADLDAVRDQLREVVEDDPDVAALAKGAQLGS